MSFPVGHPSRENQYLTVEGVVRSAMSFTMKTVCIVFAMVLLLIAEDVHGKPICADNGSRDPKTGLPYCPDTPGYGDGFVPPCPAGHFIDAFGNCHPEGNL
ncbi:uncharacterized protein LOC144472026 [Augochlora pura]